MDLTQHHVEDVLLYIPFLVGQLIYIVKRAGFSMRAGRAPTRRAYIYQNWDVIGFRSVLEFIGIFMPIRHWSPAQILSIFHINWNWITASDFMNNPVTSPVSFLAAGIAADGLVDWAVDWASRSSKVPEPVRIWLSENVASTPLAQALSVKDLSKEIKSK